MHSRDHSVLAQKEEQIRTWLAELREESNRMEQELMEVGAEMALRNFQSGPLKNYKICIIAET